MRISIQACIEGEGSQPSKVIPVGVVERQDSFAPAAGLGLFMRETHALLNVDPTRLCILMQLRGAFERPCDSGEAAHAQDRLDLLKRPWWHLDRSTFADIRCSDDSDQRGPQESGKLPSAVRVK
ncbi:hypothetical protein [Variovorax guangxiensis]|uniref:hypothetical protein n=1 Tax=Variovorax guangxiensis TaxID=1775474 RepID=UPI002856DEDB|nr:hypothetical protein [Variovorax guangxiensis]MDR6861373.1 hypothetical protein [Variovorax guangxiensis]